MDVKLKTDQGKAIVEGKTAVPFKTFVGLVLQRKVFALFKKWGDEPVIIDSELLTGLASAPSDSQENRSQLVLVTLGVGVLCGIFVAAIAHVVLLFFKINLGQMDYLMIAGALIIVAILASVLSKAHSKAKGQKLTETMERVAGLLSK